METKKKHIPFTTIWICTTILLIGLSACGADDAVNQAVNVLQKDDPHIVYVKEGSPTAYPDKTYGEAFETFFASPSWKYFKGSNDGSDETCDIVEFTGYCTYQDVQVQACLQFTLDVDSNSFETTYLSFNEVPQNMLMLAALMEAAFTNEELDTVADKPPETDTPAADVTAVSADAPFLGNYAMISEYDDTGANLSLYYSDSDHQIYVDGHAYYNTHVGEVYGAIEAVDDCHFYLEDDGRRMDITYDPEMQALTVNETGDFGGLGVTFEGIYVADTGDTQADSSSGSDDSLPTLPIDLSYPYGYYEKDGSGAMDIGYGTDENALLYFNFYKDRDESMYGGSWQDPDLTIDFDFFDLGESTAWSLTVDGIQLDISFDTTAMTIVAFGPIGGLSAEQLSGIYYCKGYAVGW